MVSECLKIKGQPGTVVCICCVSDYIGHIRVDLPEEASSRSSLLISQSREPENWAQFFLFPLIKAAGREGEEYAV